MPASRPCSALVARTILVTALSFAALSLTASFAAVAHAQDPRAEARARFGRGLELYDEGRFDAALAEFQRAYDLAPAAAVLFNIAQVHAALGHAVEAVDAFERYLAEASSISPSRRAEVDEELARQRARIATVIVETSVLGAVVSIDDVDVGSTPLPEAVRVSAGEHVIAARAPGHETVGRRLRIAGGQRETVRIELIESASPRATLRLRCAVPGVEVVLDQLSLGLTPFETSVQIAAGVHRVLARRAGYRVFEQEVAAPVGSEVVVDIVLERDPFAPAAVLGELALVLPDAAWTGTIDGAPLSRGETRIDLPAGPHDVVLEVAQRRAVHTRVDVAGAGTTELRPALDWTPDVRQSAHEAIDLQHGFGVAMLSLGALVLPAGIAVFVWNQDAWVLLDAEEAAARAACPATPRCDDFLRMHGFDQLDPYTADLNRRRRERAWIDAGAAVAMGLGSALLIAGGVMLIATPSHGQFEESASARVALRLGPGSLMVDGTF